MTVNIYEELKTTIINFVLYYYFCFCSIAHTQTKWECCCSTNDE